MDADVGSTPIVSGGIYNQSQAYQPTTVLTPSRFWNKKQFIWNIFNSVVCSPWTVDCLRASQKARNDFDALPRVAHAR
jgi:hypothetical protein